MKLSLQSLLPALIRFGVFALILSSPPAFSQTPAQNRVNNPRPTAKDETRTPAQIARANSSKLNGILINADNMDRDSVNETMSLEGHVQIVYQGQHIKADRAKVNLRSRRVELYGHVEVATTKSTLGGEEIQLDYETNTGIIHNGYVQSGSVLFEGRLLEKTGDEEYFVSDADYTTCTNCPASWSFKGSTIRATLGGYAYIKNSILRIGDIPVLWLPYLIVPLKSDRQSGFLTPSFERSNSGGLTLEQPYFWAISRSTDATISVRNYELRGTKLLGQYRYVPNENSNGELNAGFIRDSVFGRDDTVRSFRPGNDPGKPYNRWFTRYNHYYELPNEVVHRAKINLASDLQYPRDFPLETLNNGDAAMENTMSFTKNTEDQHYSAQASYYVNMLHTNPLSGNEDAVHRLPELRFSQVSKNIGTSDWLWGIDLDYTNFGRTGPAYDDLTPVYDYQSPTSKKTSRIRNLRTTCGTDPTYDNDPLNRRCSRIYDGTYDPSTDLIRTGQRFDFMPSLYRTFKPMEGLDIVPKISYRETHYTFAVGDEPNNVRRYFRTELASRLNFGRVFEPGSKDPKATRYKHEIQPEVTYTAIPWLDHKAHPFFGKTAEAPFSTHDKISDLDIGSDFGLQFDYNDRVYDRNLVTFAVVNRLVEKRYVNDQPTYRQTGYLKLAQSFDAYQDSLNDPNKQPWSDVSATLDIRLDHFETYTIVNYFPYQKVNTASSRVRLTADNGQFLQVALSKYYNNLIAGQEVNPDDRVEDYAISTGIISRYVNLVGRFVYDSNFQNSQTGKKIKSWAYITQFKPPGDCWTISFTHYQATGGDTNFRMSFEFNFDGSPRPGLPPEALDGYPL